MTFSTAPAHPHANGVAVYLVLFINKAAHLPEMKKTNNGVFINHENFSANNDTIVLLSPSLETKKEQRTENKDKRTKNEEQLEKNKDQRTMIKDQRTKNKDQRTKNQEPKTKNQKPKTKNKEQRTKNKEQRTKIFFMILPHKYKYNFVFLCQIYVSSLLTLGRQNDI